MRELSRDIRANVLNFEELQQKTQFLLGCASRVRLNAQAMYSHYLVGAAVLDINGRISVGCNVERVSWTQTTHAEQSAVDAMVAAWGSVKIEAVAIVDGPADKEIVFPPKRVGPAIMSIDKAPAPCGHCLQIIWENCFNDPNVSLISLAGNGEVVVTTIGDAFPMRFGPNDLGIQYGK